MEKINEKISVKRIKFLCDKIRFFNVEIDELIEIAGTFKNREEQLVDLLKNIRVNIYKDTVLSLYNRTFEDNVRNIYCVEDLKYLSTELYKAVGVFKNILDTLDHEDEKNKEGIKSAEFMLEHIPPIRYLIFMTIIYILIDHGMEKIPECY